MSRIFRVVGAVIAWAALALQYGLILEGRSSAEIARVTVNYFSYFTILANIACALCLTWPKTFSSPNVRGGAALYIAVTGAIYVTILRHVWAPAGLHWVADTALHYVMPALFLIDWLVLTPKGKLTWTAALVWLGFPLVYAAWTLFHGSQSGFWPYPFVDAGKLGMNRALINMAAMSTLFLALGLALVAIDNLLGRLKRG